MDLKTRRFIENATLLFIASRNAEGAMDVSPRGGQPTVLTVSRDDTLLLPDYNGNRRLDTISNILANPRVALIIVNRGCAHFLRVAANAQVSFLAEHLARFPADSNPPISVLLLKPILFEFVRTSAFDQADFWIDPARRLPPLDLGAVIDGDKAAQAAKGLYPVPRSKAEEQDLRNAGVRDVYGPPMDGVDQKIGGGAGPGALQFMEKAALTIFAREGEDAEITLDITAGAPFAAIPLDNRHAYHLSLPVGNASAKDGESALLTMIPGQNELLRINGRSVQEPGVLKIAPREVYFHCSAALSRSRIWQHDRRSFWSGKRRFRCTERHRESSDVTSFFLEPCDLAPIGPVLPGQYITISLPDASDPLRQRSYSVSRRPDGKRLRISVRRIGKGGMSDSLHDTIQAGMELNVGVPAGRFVLSSQPGRRIVLISAGVGITPLLPMLEELALEDTGREVWFIHAARNATCHLFDKEAHAIAEQAKNGGIRLFTSYSRPQQGDRCDFVGRIDSNLLAGLLPVKETDFYICGPKVFMTSLRDGLIERGAEPQSVHYEAFEAGLGGSLDLAGKGSVSGSMVTFARSGKSASWSPSDGTLLDLALKNDVEVAYSCRLGDCQSCAQKVIRGVVDHLGEEVPLLSPDQTLLCLAVPLGDLVLDC